MKKILIADDDLGYVNTIITRLKFFDYEVLRAEDGLDALDKVREFEPDLIVLDVMMPRMDGWKACKEIKNDPSTRTIPVIILTSKTQDADALKSYECGADDFVSKSCEFDDLFTAIKRLLGKQKS